MIFNRQVVTGFNEQKESPMILEAVRPTRYFGKMVHEGETIEVSKNEAKRLLASQADYFRIKID